MEALKQSPIERQLHAVGRVEGVSFLTLLLVAMPLKYLAGLPQAVLVVGSAHGVLWVLYLAMLARAWAGLRWPFAKVFLGGVASVLPLGPWWFEKWCARPSAASEAA